jgi:hypothetical protein
MGVLKSCEPREEVLQGDLEDAIFAADFGDLIAEDIRTPRVYRDPQTFFTNTHPAADLKRIVTHVFGRLARSNEGGAVIRLSTGFGGGKTHTLMALWHLAKNVADPRLGIDLLPAAGRPTEVRVIAVDAQKAGAPVFLRHGAVEVKSLQGEIAYQLGGTSAVGRLGKADDAVSQPDEALLASLFSDVPVLILLDELVIYMAGLSEQGQGNLLGVLSKLVSIAAKRPRTVLVVTDPGTQAAYIRVSSRLQKVLEASTKLGEILGRRASDFDPIGGDSARVIARRLFKSVLPSAPEAASATYHSLYERVVTDHSDLVPSVCATPEYSKRLVESYPFHPRLLDTARDRLGAMEDFQKSRGVLRLFARILRDAWERGEDLELITAGDLDWSSPRIRGDLLQRLNRDSFASAVSADIEGHAGQLDGGKKDVHTRVAAALLLESLPMHANSGLTPDELTLAVLRPDEAGPEPAEALDRLAGVCWHTYPMPGGRGWQFRYDPNVIKQIEERRARLPREDAEARVFSEAQQYFGGAGFKVRAWPESAKQVPDSAELQLALCRNETIARAVCAYADDSDLSSLIPRRYINAIVAITATPDTLENAISRAQGLIAAETIEKEYRTGEQSAQIREQLRRVKPEFEKQFKIQARRAFDRVVLSGDQSYGIDDSLKGGDDEILRQPRGQDVLRRFLSKNQLIYETTDALDPNRFAAVLPGATPQPGRPGVYSAKAVLERLYGAEGLRLIPDEEVVRRTILRAVSAGKVVVRTPDGRAFDTKGSVEGPPNGRKRVDGARLTAFVMGADVLVALPDSPTASEWLHEDRKAGSDDGPPPPPPPPAGNITVVGAEEAAKAAATRPVLALRLKASKPVASQKLAPLGQPFGAEAITLSINTSGPIRAGGGTMSYTAEGVKLTHPARPLETAALVANSLAGGSYFEAVLHLLFGQGRTGMSETIGRLRDHADDVAVEADLGPEASGQR